MDGLAVKVKTTDGVEKLYKLTPRIIVAFEQNFGAGMPKLLGEQQKVEHLKLTGFIFRHILNL